MLNNNKYSEFTIKRLKELAIRLGIPNRFTINREFMRRFAEFIRDICYWSADPKINKLYDENKMSSPKKFCELSSGDICDLKEAIEKNHTGCCIPSDSKKVLNTIEIGENKDGKPVVSFYKTRPSSNIIQQDSFTLGPKGRDNNGGVSKNEWRIRFIRKKLPKSL